MTSPLEIPSDRIIPMKMRTMKVMIRLEIHLVIRTRRNKLLRALLRQKGHHLLKPGPEKSKPRYHPLTLRPSIQTDPTGMLQTVQFEHQEFSIIDFSLIDF